MHYGEGRWEDEWHLRHFGSHWLPAISGTRPERFLKVDVAFPFEFNSYESWDTAFRVMFVLPNPDQRLVTPAHVMNGWRSEWATVWNRVSAAAELEFERRTGRRYEIGDNCYGEMRAFIQSGTGAAIGPKPPALTVVQAKEDGQ